MARKKGFVHSMAQAQREAERRRAAQERAETRAQREAERAQREQERSYLADQKERGRLYAESRAAQAALQDSELKQEVASLQGLLSHTLSIDDYFDLQTLKQPSKIPAFEPGRLAAREAPPALEDYLPKQSLFAKFLPGAAQKYATKLAPAQASYEAERLAHAAREQTREDALAQAKLQHDLQVEMAHKKAAAQHSEVDALEADLRAGAPEAVVEYCALVLEASEYPHGFPQHSKLAYGHESRQLVIEYDLPSFEIVPVASGYKYVKSKDEIPEIPRSTTQRKALYASVVAQITLRTLHELFEADRFGLLDTIVFNGYVEAIDPGTGRLTRTCIVTLRTTRDAFAQIDLSRVEPTACLKALSASVSKSASELLPVRPVLEFSMVDSRFVEEADVLSGLD